MGNKADFPARSVSRWGTIGGGIPNEAFFYPGKSGEKGISPWNLPV
jgi:hypothetical protein